MPHAPGLDWVASFKPLWVRSELRGNDPRVAALPPVSNPYRYGRNGRVWQIDLKGAFHVSNPYRYGRNRIPTPPLMCWSGVSNPYRYGRNMFVLVAVLSLTRVSNPYRYGRNDAHGGNQAARYPLFQTLIGTVGTRRSARSVSSSRVSNPYRYGRNNCTSRERS